MRVQSTLYDKISGSIGNITGAMGRGGNYFKGKSNPRNPDTARQRAVRNGLAAANVAWTGGTIAQREAWEVYGATCTYESNTGNIVSLTGWNAFSRAYVVFVQADIATAGLIASAPAGTGFLGNAVLTVAANADDTMTTVTNKGIVDVNIAVYLGTTTKPTINNYGGSFQYNTKSTLAADAEVLVVTGANNGKKWLRFQTYTADGQLSRGQVLNYVKA